MKLKTEIEKILVQKPLYVKDPNSKENKQIEVIHKRDALLTLFKKTIKGVVGKEKEVEIPRIMLLDTPDAVLNGLIQEGKNQSIKGILSNLEEKMK